jgi:tetratricopeptide (TPR) repeat protein
VAEVQGGSTKASLGDTVGALESLRRGDALLEDLAARAPEDRAVRRARVEVAADLTHLFRETGDMAQAEAHARRAARDAEALIADTPPDLELRETLARTYDTLGMIELEAGRVAEALAIQQRQLALLEAAPAAERREPRLRRALSVAHQHVADARFAAGDHAGALESHRRSLAERQALAAEHPLNADYRRLVAVGLFYEADTLDRMGRTREALDAFRRSHAIQEELAAADPKAAASAPAWGLMQIGAMLAKLGDHAAAATHLRQAGSHNRAVVAADPGSLWKRAGLIQGETRLCAALAELASDEAIDVCAATAALLDSTPVDPADAAMRTYFAGFYSMLGDAYARIGEREATATRTAREMYRRSLDLWEDLAARSLLAADDAEKPAAVARALARTEAELGE